MSAIKICSDCDRFYTGGTPRCPGCYFASLAPVQLPVVQTLTRAQRRALKKKQPKSRRPDEAPRWPKPLSIWPKRDLNIPVAREAPSADPASLVAPFSRQNLPLLQAKSPVDDALLRRPPATPEDGIVCPLCGVRVPPRQMLEHKHQAHGEQQVVPSPAQPHNENRWVHVSSGGLPSLGKNSR